MAPRYYKYYIKGPFLYGQDDYKQMLSDTGACILLKDKPGDYKVMSTYSIKKEKKRGTSTKKKKKK